MICHRLDKRILLDPVLDKIQKWVPSCPSPPSLYQALSVRGAPNCLAKLEAFWPPHVQQSKRRKMAPPIAIPIFGPSPTFPSLNCIEFFASFSVALFPTTYQEDFQDVPTHGGGGQNHVSKPGWASIWLEHHHLEQFG